MVDASVVDEGDRALAQAEAAAALGAAWRLLADRCVSPPDAMQAARWKPMQLGVARRLGLRVPETLVTSDPAAAAGFLAGGPTILKAVAEARTRGADGERAGGTVLVDERADLAAVTLAPILLQRRIDKVADMRVTLVGRRAFAVRIRTPEGAPLDFRLTSPRDCTFERVDLDFLEPRLQAFMNHYGLRYGAFDLAEDRAGDLWFLECNAAGQWGWLEEPAGVDITGAIVDLLVSPKGTT